MRIGRVAIRKKKLIKYLKHIRSLPNSNFFPSTKIKESWDKNHIFRYYLILESLKKHLSDSSKILDVGIHPYSLASLLKTELKCEVIGICKSHDLGDGFKKDKRHFIKEEFGIPGYLLNVEKDIFPFPENIFDIVIFTEIIEHLLFSPTHALYEIHRVLKKDGALIITTPNAISLVKLLKWLKRTNLFDQISLDDIYGRHNREYTKKELEVLLNSCNFKIDDIFLFSLPFDCRNIFRKIFYTFSWLKEYIFIKATPKGRPVKGFPNEIYRRSLS